ncbi:MAG TPA: carboxypeptidase regulatory-like domain-containing protein, partial [Terriglobales bacterium]|nr:carboxypeptidase regulatory-like domain-containing protein [Terriglobales bacterium]
MTRWKQLSLLLAVSLLASLCAFGQATATGTIEGTVTDNSQAVVVGAEVVATYKATGVTRTATTNGTGNYRFDFLPAGAYTIKVTKSGFASLLQGAELLVGQTATINASLKLGATSQTVEVTTQAPLIDLAKTSVSQDITPSEVENMPLVGRDAADLAYLAPGVKAADSYDPTKNRYAILSINGSDGRNVNTTVNGIDNKDNTVGGAVMQLPLEAVQEFQISTQRFSAENGRSQGAAINMITKSGSNDYHGSVFGYFRNSAIDADQKVPNGDGKTTTSQNPDYSRQFFGGSIGGPIKKDKLFAFFALERQRESQGLAEDSKAYSELVLAQQNGLLADPALVVPTPFYETRYNGRMDYNINSRNSAYISYSSQANNSLNDQSNGTYDLSEGNFTVNHLQIANLTLTSQISNTSVNQFTFGWQYWNNLIDSTTKVPLVTFPSAQFGTNTNVPQQSYQRKWQFKDDYSKTIGNHTLKAGVDFIYNPVEGGFFESNSTLEIDFGVNPSTILGDPGTYPQKFGTPGLITGMSYSNGDPYFLVATKQLGLYAQDDWKVTPRLTLNLGLRWDRDFNALGQSVISQSRTYQELVAINSPLTNPYVSSLPHDDALDFSPRVGFAYDLTGAGKHVLRGGFGMYYGNTFQNIPLFMEQQANPTLFQGVFSISGAGDIVPGTGLTLSQWQYGISPFPTLPPPSSTLNSGSTGRLIDPNYRNPVTEEFNLGYTWAVNNNTAVEAEYTHVLGLHENKTVNIDQRVVTGVDGSGNAILTAPLNAAFAAAGQPVLGSVRNEESINRNRYDGINFSYRQRMTHRVSLNANYTLAWANGYDYSGAASFRNYPRNAYAPLASYEWGPTANDERHHITLSGIIQLPKGFEFAPILQFGSARPYSP